MNTEKTPEKSRKTRHDKGSIKANDRDILALTWIAQQYAANFDDIHELLHRHPGPGVSKEGLSESAVRQVIARWRRAGWVGYQQLLAGEPPWIWITKFGLQTLGLTQYTATTPALSRIRHMNAVNSVRLMIEDDEDEWISERDIRAGKFYAKGATGHTPDAILKTGDDTVAIEVELTPKKPDDIDKILHTLLNAWDDEAFGYLYTDVWYYVVDVAVEKALLAAKERQKHRRGQLVIRRFNMETLDTYEDKKKEEE